MRPSRRRRAHSIPIWRLAAYHAARHVKPLSLSLTRLRFRGAEKPSQIKVEKQPVFVCSSETVPPLFGRLCAHLFHPGCSCLVMRIESLSRLDDRKGDMQQFPGTCTASDFHWFAGLSQVVIEVFDHGMRIVRRLEWPDTTEFSHEHGHYDQSERDREHSFRYCA